jgi:excinuclease ABC subunit C
MAPRLRKRPGDSRVPPAPEPNPEELKRKIASLPTLPGVYVFKGAGGTVLYVGKAKRLDQRVRSHFQSPDLIGPRQVALTRKVLDLDFIAVDSEGDALLLEATLVREHQPPYNIRLKDDKRYPYIRVSWQEAFPRMSLVRRIERDGGRYFGPYTEVKALRQLLRMTQTIFPMRSCQDIDAHIAAGRECLDFHIGRCTGPCIGMQTQAEYRSMVEQFCDFLAGKREHVVETLQALQKEAAARREYERAGRIRDQVRGLESILARQRVVDLSGSEADVVGVARQGEAACAVIFKIRERRVLSRDVRWLSGAGKTDEAELLRAFLTLYYTRAEQVPACVLVEVEPEEMKLLEEVLSSSSGAGVRVRTPRGPAERALVRTARRNASLLLGHEADDTEGARPLRANEFEEALELQRELGLAHLPRRVRCFDVSTIQGRHTVASMVTFRDGTPFKGEYRRFRIATVPGQDDFASMAEAVGRHAARVQEGEIEPADLIVIDGGVGQLEAARGAARGTPLEGVPFVGLAKRLEEIFVPGRRDSLVLSRRSPAVKLLMRIRDEAHRFAIGYHRLVRAKAARASALDTIPGLGPKRRALLLQRFGSLERMRRQPADAIAAVPGIGPRMAKRILREIGPGTGASA